MFQLILHILDILGTLIQTGTQLRQSLNRHLRTFSVYIDQGTFLGNRDKIRYRLEVIDQNGVIQHAPFRLVLSGRTGKERNIVSRSFQTVDILITELTPYFHISQILLDRLLGSDQLRFLILQFLYLTHQLQAFLFRQLTGRGKLNVFLRRMEVLKVTHQRIDLFTLSQKLLQPLVIHHGVCLLDMDDT